jgi:uncharacterized protein YgfB (UPF0149 family)
MQGKKMNNPLDFIPDNYDDLFDWLSTFQCNFSASELHGAIVGALCGGMRLEKGDWANFIISFMGLENQKNTNFDQNAIEVACGFAQNQLKTLLSEDISFNPFIPDDDELIDLRIEAVSFWCKGFLGGFAEAQIFARNNSGGSSDSDVKSLDHPFSDNVQEALTDIAAISKVVLADGGSDEHRDSSEVSEQEEKDLMEVVEFMRLVTLTIFAEYGHIENLKKPIRSNSSISDLGVSSDNKTFH